MNRRDRSVKNIRIFKFRCMFQILLILSTVSSTEVSECCECPQPCECKWIMGKRTAICISAGFESIPALGSDIHVLNLNNNKISYLEEDAFRSVGLINLQKIFMRNVTLKQMHADTFKNMTILVELNLADNFLTSIPVGSFDGNVRLKMLVLNGNPLKMLMNGQFPLLPCLRTLELEGCQLHYIEDEAFSNLNALEILNLKLNNLQSVSKVTFANLTNLKSLALEGNPWYCDCHLRSFRDWYLSSSLLSLSPLCYEPEIFQQKLWINLNSEDFGCQPNVFISDGDVVYKDIGDNLTLSCNIKGDPESRVTWLFNGLPLDAMFNSSYSDNIFINNDNDDSENIWSFLNVKELNEFNFGSYVCLAKSTTYLVEARALVKLPEVPNMQNIVRSHAFWFLFTGISVLSLILFILMTSAVACGCMSYNRKKKRKIEQLAKVSDPERHLLDVSLSHSRKSSCEKLDDLNSYDVSRYSGSLHVRRPTGSSQYVTAFPVQPITPPKEYGMSRSRTLGNVYQTESKGAHYRSKPNLNLSEVVKEDDKASKRKASSSVSDVSLLPFATLPRRQFNLENTSSFTPKYDNMGKRVSVRGSSTLSFHDIPPPPPAPLSTNPDFDFVPL